MQTGTSLVLFLPILWFWYVNSEAHEKGINIPDYDSYGRIPYRDYKHYFIGDNKEKNKVTLDSAQAYLYCHKPDAGVFIELVNCKYKDLIDVINIAINKNASFIYENDKVVIYKSEIKDRRIMTFDWPTKEAFPYE